MAGPISSVLLKTIPDQAMLAVIDAVIDEFAAERDGLDFYIKESTGFAALQSMKEAMRPFGYDITYANDEEFFYTPEELKAIATQTDMIPVAEVDLYAMSNGEIDHQYLGRITLRMAEALDGLINFGGQLPTHYVSKLNGSLYTIEYTIDDEETSIYHISDPEFLRNWLQHEHFRMVK